VIRRDQEGFEMDYSSAFAISAAGMAAERLRVEVAALNLANANTVSTAESGGYQPMRVVTRAEEVMAPSFADRFSRGLDELGVASLRLPVATVERTGAVPLTVHDPGHPLADERGDIRHPGVDAATEMVTLMSAMRAYEASVAALNTTRTLVLKTLEIGSGT
jgi:flagellar basal-body rod protein FlgC